MFYGVSHLVVPVTDLQRTTNLWSEAMGFSILRRGEGYADIDSGNVAIRLMQVPTIESKISLRISVRNVPEAYQALLRGGATPRYEPMRTPELEEMACVSDHDGHSLILWRELTEDEWGFTPALPTQGEWQPDAEQLLQRLLSHVPALFRMLARRKTTRVIEQLARETNSAVTREIVIKGYITASAKVTRYRLVEPLRSEGINPDDYREDFDYE
jgi:hypothetical protein